MELLRELIEIDKSAAARVEALREEQSHITAQSGIDASQQNDRIVAEARAELESFTAAQQSAVAEKKRSAAAEQEKQMTRLDEYFSAHREEWAKDILKRVTGV